MGNRYVRKSRFFLVPHEFIDQILNDYGLILMVSSVRSERSKEGDVSLPNVLTENLQIPSFGRQARKHPTCVLRVRSSSPMKDRLSST